MALRFVGADGGLSTRDRREDLRADNLYRNPAIDHRYVEMSPTMSGLDNTAYMRTKKFAIIDGWSNNRRSVEGGCLEGISPICNSTPGSTL